jgi:hypothetical protein
VRVTVTGALRCKALGVTPAVEISMVGLALRGNSGSRSDEELVMLRLQDAATRPAKATTIRALRRRPTETLDPTRLGTTFIVVPRRRGEQVAYAP